MSTALLPMLPVLLPVPVLTVLLLPTVLRNRLRSTSGKYFESKPCNFSNKQSIKACSCAGFASTKMDGDDNDDDDDSDGDDDDDTLLAMASLLPTVKASHY